MNDFKTPSIRHRLPALLGKRVSRTDTSMEVANARYVSLRGLSQVQAVFRAVKARIFCQICQCQEDWEMNKTSSRKFEDLLPKELMQGHVPALGNVFSPRSRDKFVSRGL